MTRSVIKLIRALLRENPDGMTALELQAELETKPGVIYRALKHTPDAYIDRWVRASRGPFTAVWCVVPVPENCPKPKGRRHA